MSYSSVIEMSSNSYLVGRFIVAAAVNRETRPDEWVPNNLWHLLLFPGLVEKWESATDSPIDKGLRSDVISDADILAAVKAI